MNAGPSLWVLLHGSIIHFFRSRTALPTPPVFNHSDQGAPSRMSRSSDELRIRRPNVCFLSEGLAALAGQERACISTPSRGGGGWPIAYRPSDGP